MKIKIIRGGAGGWVATTDGFLLAVGHVPTAAQGDAFLRVASRQITAAVESGKLPDSEGPRGGTIYAMDLPLDEGKVERLLARRAAKAQETKTCLRGRAIAQVAILGLRCDWRQAEAADAAAIAVLVRGGTSAEAEAASIAAVKG